MKCFPKRLFLRAALAGALCLASAPTFALLPGSGSRTVTRTGNSNPGGGSPPGGGPRTNIAAVPEAGSVFLLGAAGVGALGYWLVRRRGQSATQKG